MKALLFSAFSAVLLAASAAAADPMPARDTAYVMPVGKWRAGIFAPLEVGAGHGMEVSASLWQSVLLAPNASIRAELGKIGDATITGEYGLSVPTGTMVLAKGYLFPSFANGPGDIGWSVVPTVGLWVSAGDRGVFTGRLETAFGIPLGRTDVTAPDTYAPVELMFAPALTGYRARVGGMYDYAVFDWMRVRIGASAYMVGHGTYPMRDPFYLAAEAALDIRLGSRVRVSLGGVYYNYDQRATDVTLGGDGRLHRVAVRSNDVFPTIDLIIGSK
jgi:hypothetical protein